MHPLESIHPIYLCVHKTHQNLIVGSLNKGHSGHSQAERLQSQHVNHQMMDPPKRGRASESRLAHSYLTGIGTISCPCFLRQDSHPGLAAFHHQVSLDRWKMECLPVKSPWYPTYIGFGASYLTFFVWFWCWNFHFGVFGWWKSHAFDAEAIGFQSWAVLAICRNSKPTVPLLVWHTWELRPCFLSSECQFGKTPFRWFIYQQTTWNWLFWGIPYFLTNPFQIRNC